ncbi:tripartite tricarboxylate transporter permease [Jiangella asiatica]|uniref:Tripartite tricarboxylate transporter permease n=1 Tax=Jiangella asiatica TaxID=2530372 RepID=A0A4R5CTM2_9ACTN|nr:tripartite tricarboxylate transporter permease [Jiangella asiatica]TDE01155.1 tripartite tricarboxylate transporter permease [Jiangella asiatica]
MELLDGFQAALSPENLLYAVIGAILGTLIGVLPGIGPTAGIAVLIPLTTVVPPAGAIIMMAAIYYGAMYGGSTTAIVANIPGEATSVITALDGYELAKKGRAGPALAVAAISSFVAGSISLVGLSVFAPALARWALEFGPPEYFALLMVAFSLVITLSGRTLLKGVASAALGMLVALIGVDAYSGGTRLTFGIDAVSAGLNYVAIIIGLFAVGEVLFNVEKDVKRIYEMAVTRWLPTRHDLKESAAPALRSSVTGFFLGLLPGCTPVVSTMIAYDVERRVSKRGKNFGKGEIAGVAAAEGANNAAVSGGFVPLFALGIPSGATMAVLLGAFMIYGIQPGPRMFTEHPDILWALIASMYIGNVVLLILNLPLVGIWARLAKIPFPALAGLIVVFSIIGAYSVRNSMFDVWVMLIFGVVGYLMRKLEIPLAPLVLAAVLAQLVESSLRQSLATSHGAYTIFFTRPISAVLMIAAIVLIVRGVWVYVRNPERKSAVLEDVD